MNALVHKNFVTVIQPKTMLFLLACCWLIVCNNRDKQQQSALDARSQNQTSTLPLENGISKNSTSPTHVDASDVIGSLREKYQKHKVTYYNDLNCLGIGVVNPKRFDFPFVSDTITKTGVTIDNIEEQEYIIPIFWKPDYQIFYMPVLDSAGDYYTVKVNTEASVFVNKKDFDFYTWEELFTKRAISVVAEKGCAKQYIESECVAIDNNNVSLVVERYDADWLSVKEELEDGNKRNTYWVKWRDQNKVLVKPIFLM